MVAAVAVNLGHEILERLCARAGLPVTTAYRVHEVSTILGITPASASELIQREGIARTRVSGRIVFISADDLAAFLERKHQSGET